MRNSFEIGSGYSNDTGPRAKIVWKKPWVNSYGHSLENHFSLSMLEQFIDINYKIPIFRNPVEEYYLIQGGWIYENIYNLQSQIMSVNIARYWNYLNEWQRVVNLHWYVNQCIQKNNLMKTIMLICPGISINRIQQRGEGMPYWGSSQRYTANISTNYWKSDVDFIILQAQNVWIRTLVKKHRILMRSNLHWMKINNLSFIVPTLRFFFNQDRGIRGYDNKSLMAYDYFKYTKLITTTIEYQYNVLGKWWSSIFIDMGEINDYFKWKDFKFGAGIGIRWQLPVGPIKLDIAIPLIRSVKINHNFLHFYVNLGPEL